MITYLLKGVLTGMAVTVLSKYRRLSIQLLKIEAATYYLRGVRMARGTALGVLRMGLALGLIGVGVLIFHVGLFSLLPWTLKAKAVLGMLLGVVYVAIGGGVLHAAMDEKRWMERSGAAEMLREAGCKPRRD